MSSKLNITASLGRTIHFSWMFSFGVSVVIGSVGCSRLFGDKNPPPKIAEVKTTKEAGSCLADSMKIIPNFFKQEESPQKAESVAECAVDALDQFTKNTRGEQQSGRYSADELTTFIRQHISAENEEFDPRTVSEIILLKQSLYGGDAKSVSEEEIVKIRELILYFKSVSTKLAEFTDIYSLRAELNPTSAEDLDRLERSLVMLSNLATDLGAQFSGGKDGVYSFDHLRALLSAFPSTKDFVEKLPLLAAAKSVLVNAPVDGIRGNEWAPLLSAAAKVYGGYLRYHYVIQKSEIFSGVGFDHALKVLNAFLDLMQTSIKTHDSKQISISEVMALVHELAIRDYFPKQISQDAMRQAMKVAVQKWLKPIGSAHVLDRDGIGEDERLQLKSILEDWLTGHKILMAGFGEGRDQMNVSELQSAIKDRMATSGSARQLLDLYSRGRPMKFDSELRLLILPVHEIDTVTKFDLAITNAIRAGFAMVFSTYSVDSTRAKSLQGITRDELQEFYLDVRPIGINLGLMDQRSDTAGRKGFLQASLFTSVSDGNQIVSLHEVVEFFGLILSGGKSAKRVYQALAPKCSGSGVDLDKLPTLKVDCVRENLLQAMSVELKAQPNLQRYLSDLVAGSGDVPQATGRIGKSVAELPLDQSKMQANIFARRRDSLLEALEDAGRNVGYDDASEVEASELVSMIPILTYAESLMIRFDLDRNDVLSKDEVWAAFPLFADTIRVYSEGKADTQANQKAVFSYLLDTGQLPDPNIGTFAMAQYYFFPESSSRGDIPREGVVNIIANLTNKSRSDRRQEFIRWWGQAKGLSDLLRRGDLKAVAELVSRNQCMPEASAPMREWLAKSENWQSIVAADSGNKAVGADEKALKVLRVFQSAIKSDDQLKVVCLPFY